MIYHITTNKVLSHTLHKLGYINIGISIITRQDNNNYFVILITNKGGFSMSHIDKKNNKESKKTGQKTKKNQIKIR